MLAFCLNLPVFLHCGPHHFVNLTGMTEYMKAKLIKWGFKLFALAGSSNGYTLYTGCIQFASGIRLASDYVMCLLKPAHLGTCYHF